MVYRGKPSAGCESCRKAKKRCTLEHPACARCVKLRKPCTGYRDTTALQIEDESQAVISKANRRKTASPAQPAFYIDFQEIAAAMIEAGRSASSSHSSPDDDTNIPTIHDEPLDLLPTQTALNGSLILVSGGTGMLLQPKADDIAFTNFFNSFTSSEVWGHIRGLAGQRRMNPCLEFAIRACGMAALDNVGNVVMGKEYSRSMYARSLSLLNEALRDPDRCKQDETLIAVAMLGYFENLTCDSRESIQSWKAHINGAASLLRVRGKAQFQTPMGRLLFRETRAQILINCLWDDSYPPVVLREWDDDLQALTSAPREIVFHADKLTRIIYDYCVIRHAICNHTMGTQEAVQKVNETEELLNEWANEAMTKGDAFHYTEYDLPESPHVWNGMVYDYKTQIGAAIWNTWRCILIMVTRSQESTAEKLGLPQADFDERMRALRKKRRHLTEGICASVPCALGHAAPAFNSSCVLITAYSTVWPLFFAGTCALERVGLRPWSETAGDGPVFTSAAAAQVAWIIGRLDYIADRIGLRWAKGIAAALRGDFAIHNDLLPDHAAQGRKEAWVVEMQSSGRGPSWLLEMEGDSTHPGAELERPIWRGRATGDNPRHD